jgi:hypothetical protein
MYKGLECINVKCCSHEPRCKCLLLVQVSKDLKLFKCNDLAKVNLKDAQKLQECLN